MSGWRVDPGLRPPENRDFSTIRPWRRRYLTFVCQRTFCDLLSRKRILRTRSAACECRTRVLPSPERACNGAAHGLGAAFRAGRQLSRRSDRRRGSRGLACRDRIRARGSSQPARLWFRAAPWRSVARCRPASGAFQANPAWDRLSSPPGHITTCCSSRGSAAKPSTPTDWKTIEAMIGSKYQDIILPLHVMIVASGGALPRRGRS